MINKIYTKLRDKFFLATVYDKIFIFGINKIVGKLSLIFFKFIYTTNLKIGTSIKCWGSVSLRINQNATVTIGNNCTIVSNNNRAGITVFTKFKITALFDSKIYIGNNVSFNGTSLSCRTSSISIGSGTIIGPNVIIVDSDFHGIYPPENRENNLDYASDRPVNIGKNVWIGMNTVILKGVDVGENSVIAAGSIVSNDIPSNCLAAGNPAKIIKKLEY